jgi:hypothetical protein
MTSGSNTTGSGQVVLSLDDAALVRLADLVVERIAPVLTTASTDDRWLDAKGAAEYLGFESVHPLHKLTARREIAFSQDTDGGKLWFHVTDLDAYRLQARIEARNGRR